MCCILHDLGKRLSVFSLEIVISGMKNYWDWWIYQCQHSRGRETWLSWEHDSLAETPMLFAVVKLMVLVLSFVTKAVKATGTGHPQARTFFSDCVCTSRASWRNVPAVISKAGATLNLFSKKPPSIWRDSCPGTHPLSIPIAADSTQDQLGKFGSITDFSSSSRGFDSIFMNNLHT